MTRVFVPSTLAGLAGVATAGGVGPAPFPAFAAAPGAEETEEGEYDALLAAAEAALALLGPDDRPVRVVLALDAPVAPEGRQGNEVLVTSVVPLADLAAVHVDTEDAAAEIQAAVAAPQDEDAVETALAHELAWYAVQEIGDLID